jgi:hypothetical protein
MKYDTRATGRKLREVRRLVGGVHRQAGALLGRLEALAGVPKADALAARLERVRRRAADGAACLLELEELRLALGPGLRALRRRVLRCSRRFAAAGGPPWYKCLALLREADHFEAASAADIDRQLAVTAGAFAGYPACLAEVAALIPPHPTP